MRGSKLVRGQTYVVVREGAWPEGQKTPLALQEISDPALPPFSCALPGIASEGPLVWLPALSSVKSCSRMVNGLELLLERPIEGGGAPTMWRIAYLTRAGASWRK